MIGRTVSHYRILEKLGSGGMGEVYLALDTDLGRQVALKFLPAGLSHDPDVRARFKREAQSLAALNHPHIVTVHGVSEHSGQPFIIMEHVHGKSLRTLCSEADVPLQQAVEWALQIAEGLAVAHKSEIVHRDIKSDNILITSDDRVKILDFGLATRQGLVRLTREGSTIGTMAYMSPEQAHGRDVDHRSDLFSLGVVLYELTTRQLPFKGEHEAAVAYAVMHEEAAPMARYASKVPDEWQRIVSKCLSKKVEERYQSAADLAADLKAFRRRLGGAVETEPAVSDKRPSIAVLPFVNLSADPENEYFSDGLTEELLNVLARNPEVKVTGRTSSFAFKGKQQDLREIGHKLGVETLLEGSVRKSGNRVRITAQIVKASDGFHMWSDTYDRVIEDVFAVQDEIAGAVSKALNVTLLGQPGTRVVRNPKAYAMILQATHLSYQNSEESLKEAVRTLEAALQLDPDNPDALAGLAYAYIIQGGYGHADSAATLQKARQAAQRAIQVDDTSIKAHMQLGWLHLMHREWSQSERESRRAEELAPGDAAVLFLRAGLACALEHPSKALETMRRAKELDPLNAAFYFHSGRMYWWSGHPEEARMDLQKALALSPDFTSAHASLAMVYLGEKDLDKALVEAGMEKENGYKHWALAAVHHALGNSRESDAAVARLERVGSQWAVQLALAESYRNHLDSAFGWLDVALEENDAGICWMANHPLAVNLHSDPRWPAFLRKIGLPA